MNYSKGKQTDRYLPFEIVVNTIKIASQFDVLSNLQICNEKVIEL